MNNSELNVFSEKDENYARGFLSQINTGNMDRMCLDLNCNREELLIWIKAALKKMGWLNCELEKDINDVQKFILEVWKKECDKQSLNPELITKPLLDQVLEGVNKTCRSQFEEPLEKVFYKIFDEISLKLNN